MAAAWQDWCKAEGAHLIAHNAVRSATEIVEAIVCFDPHGPWNYDYDWATSLRSGGSIATSLFPLWQAHLYRLSLGRGAMHGVAAACFVAAAGLAGRVEDIS